MNCLWRDGNYIKCMNRKWRGQKRTHIMHALTHGSSWMNVFSNRFLSFSSFDIKWQRTLVEHTLREFIWKELPKSWRKLYSLYTHKIYKKYSEKKRITDTGWATHRHWEIRVAYKKSLLTKTKIKMITTSNIN